MSALRPNQREKAAPSKGSAAGTLPNGLVDPTKVGKYPVILSDTLLGKTQKDVFTGVRYNHKPALSSESAPAHARLKPDTPGSQTNFELFFQDAGGKYGYEGSRTMDDNQYVLYFDPARKAFILDKVDSTFNLNLTRTPTNSNPEILRQQFQQLDASISVGLDTRRGSTETAEKQPSKPSLKKTDAPLPKSSSLAKARKLTEKKKDVKVVELALPTPEPPKPKPKPKKQKAGSDDEEEDEDDDDFGLTIEYPGSEPNRKRADFSPAFPAHVPMRRFSEFLRDSEADDADGEVDDDLEDDRGLESFKLPSPVNNHEEVEVHAEPEPMEVDSEADFEDALEDDLEAELEKELEQANSGDAEESEVSEED